MNESSLKTFLFRTCRHLLVAILTFWVTGGAARASVITGISPAQAQWQSLVTLTGSGFTGATSVQFTSNGEYGLPARTTSASFVVVSDTQIAVTVPYLQIPVGFFITVAGTSSATVTLQPGATIIGSGTSVSPQFSSCFYVLAGGTLTNPGFGSMVFVKSGATVTGNSSYNTVYAEPGAHVAINGATVNNVASISPSPLPLLFQFEDFGGVPYPGPATNAATSVGATSAVANGNTNGGYLVPMGYYFEYGLTTAYGSQTPMQITNPNGSPQVSALMANLLPNSQYHYAMVADDGAGPETGADATFTTAPLVGGQAAVLIDQPASMVTCTSATLHALVNPDGTSASVYFRYGLTGTYGATTPGQAIGNGVSDVAIQASIANLQPHTTYHYEVVATSGSIAVSSNDQTFQTGAVGIYGISPGGAQAGASITLTGVGFTGASNVSLIQDVLATPVAANFIVLSDTQMTVTIPSLSTINLWGYYILVSGSQGATVTLTPGSHIVGFGTSYNPSASGQIIYVDGGSIDNSVDSGNVYFAKKGSMISLGGANLVYGEPGANIAAANSSVISEPNICQSPVSGLFQFIPGGATVMTGSAAVLGFTSATVAGSVAPNGAFSIVFVQYGTDQTYGSQTAGNILDLLPWTTTLPQVMGLTGLTPGTTYHYRFAASSGGLAAYGGVTVYGGDGTFTTASLTGSAPGVINGPAAAIGCETAVLSETIDPNGRAASACFEYGLTGTYGMTTAAQSIVGGTSDVAVQSVLQNLLPNTTYHYAGVATGAGGVTIGADRTFRTAGIGVLSISPGQATAGGTLTITGVGFTGATNVIFDKWGTRTNASFVVLSDTQMSVTVPQCGIYGGGYSITVIGGNGLTVTTDQNSSFVGNGGLSLAYGGVSNLYYIESGGVVNDQSGSGGSVFYVKNGGVMGGDGGGSNTAYVESGGSASSAIANVIPVSQISNSPLALQFQFLAPALARTGPVANLAISNAIVTGTVNPQGTDSVSYAEYGIVASPSSSVVMHARAQASPAYQNQTAPQALGSGTADIPLALNLTGLVSNTPYHYRMVATNAAGITYGRDQQFTTPAGPYDAWKSAIFTSTEQGNPAISGDTAQPAGDGIPNILKYALGMNPKAHSTADLPVIGSQMVSGTSYLTFTYTKVDAATDITYIPEWSSDLVNWSSTGATQTVLSDNGATQQIKVAVPKADKLYLHLRVTRP